MAAEKKFLTWLHYQIFSKRDEGACKKIVVRHSAGKGSEDVGYLNMPKPESIREEDSNETILLLANQLWEMAENDAAGIVGPTLQTYTFQAWFEGEPTKHLSRITARFGTEADEDGSGDGSVSEAPNGTGLVSQAMRHAEAFARIGTQASIHQLSMQQRTIESQQRLIEKLTEEKLGALEMMEDLRSKKHERELEMMEKEASFKLKTEALERLTNYLPIVAKKLLGQKALPSGATNGNVEDKSTPMVRQFLASLTPEQMVNAEKILDPSQVAMLADMMMEQQDDEKPKEGAEAPH
jgi:hypothetical protein